MVRTTKQTAVSVPEQSIVIEASTIPAPAVVKKTSVKKAKSVPVVVEPTPVVPEVVDDVVSSVPLPLPTTDVEVVDMSVAAKITEISVAIQQIVSLLATLKGKYKALEKTVSRELKAAEKASSRKSKRSGNRQPSGFVKPTKISEELAIFLQKPLGTEMARTTVSKEINQYIRTNNLQDTVNGRKINPDASLSKLLKLEPTDELTYFNLQRFMKGHFIKTEPVVVAPVVETA